MGIWVRQASQSHAGAIGTRMWKSFVLLCLASHLTTVTRAKITADDLLMTDEAIQLLQVDNVQRLEKSIRLAETSLRGKEQEVETLRGELEKSWTLVRFMMKVMKKSQGAAKAREELVVRQAAMLKELKEELAECKENIGESLKVVNKSQEVIQGQRKTIEDLKRVVVEESSLNAAYLEIKEANCDIPTYLEAITKTLTAQQEEIQHLKQAVSGEDTVTDLLAFISDAAVRGAEVVRTEDTNWGVLDKCQNVLEKQSSSLDLLRTLVSGRVTRDNSLDFTEDDQGHLVSAGFCQCIPDLPTLSNSTTEVSISLTKDEDGWSPTWSAWQYENCDDQVTSSNGTNGTNMYSGKWQKTRRRLHDLNAAEWVEDVEKVSCHPTFNPQCFEYKELNSPTRRSTYPVPDPRHCDKGGRDETRDWRGPGWYRITGEAGTKLTDHPATNNRGGTNYPGGLVGGHPSVAEGEVSRTVEFHGHPDSAKWTRDIKVINCYSHYVYYLQDTELCFLGYSTE